MNKDQIRLTIFLTLQIEGGDITTASQAIRFTKLWCGQNNLSTDTFDDSTVSTIYDLCCREIDF